MRRSMVSVVALTMALVGVVEAVVIPTNEWVNFLSSNTSFQGNPVPVGAVVDAYDPQGVHCGTFTVTTAGRYGMMAVYRDYPGGPDEGAEPGDIITCYINGIRAYPFGPDDPIWTTNAAVLEVGLTVFPAPTVTSVDPDSVLAGAGVTIHGDDFLAIEGDTCTVEIVVGVDTTALTGVTFVDSTQVTARVPAGMPVGTYDVVVTNPDGQSGTLEDGLTVIPIPLEIMTTSLVGGTVGVAYSETLTATGGVLPYSWGITVGSLPGGLSLNGTTGEISGTPTTVETQPFTVEVTDSADPAHTDTQVLSITTVLVLVSIQVTPSPSDSIVVDSLRHVPSTLQYTATGTYAGGSDSNLTAQAVWTSSDTTVATVDSVGLASSVSPGGPVWIKAAMDGIVDSTQLKVAALGDVQCDGDVDTTDARLVLKIIVEKDPYDVPERPTTFEFDAADFMTDDMINVFDVVGIVRHILDPLWVPSWPKPVLDEEAQLVVAKAMFQEDGVADASKEVRIPIEIATYRPMTGVEILLRYNPGALSRIAPQLTHRTQRMRISYHASENGALRVVLYSLTGDTIPAGSGPVLRVGFEPRGTKPARLTVEEVLLADQMGRSVPVRTTALEWEAVRAIPTVYALSQNFPNPFNVSTTIAFDLPVQGKVDLSIYSLDGQRICSLVDEVRHAGSYSVVWDGKDEAGHAVASGVYFYRLRAGDFVSTKRMVVLK